MKKDLVKAKDSEDADGILDILKAIQSLPISVQELQETQVAHTIRPLKKYDDNRVQSLAKAIINAWKVIRDKTYAQSEPTRKSSRITDEDRERLKGLARADSRKNGGLLPEEAALFESKEDERSAPSRPPPRGVNPTAPPVKPPKTKDLVDMPGFDLEGAKATFASFDVCPTAPKRSQVDRTLYFAAAPGAKKQMKDLVNAFRPNRTPEEVLRAGAFGGTYFRNIYSSVTRKSYQDQWKELPSAWVQGLKPGRYLSRGWGSYDVSVNKFKAKCGQTLEQWESSGWMMDQDPYGWFQWYCRFFQGRRSGDDARQIGRWLKCCGPKGRWKSNLCGKVIIAGKAFNDPSVSPVVRQTLLHWAYELTEQDFAETASRIKKGSGATYVPKFQLESALAGAKK